VTLAELRALALGAGFVNPSLAAAVAMAESGGDPHAQGDPRGPFLPIPNGVSTSFGLWQIHVPDHPQYSAQSLLDPIANAAAALAISSGGRKWSAWSTFNDGSYAQYMPGGAVAVPAAIGLFAAAAAGVLLGRTRSRPPLF
jgi:hypothetical protein